VYLRIFMRYFAICFALVEYFLNAAESIAAQENIEDIDTRTQISCVSVPNYTEIYQKELKKSPAHTLNHFSIAHLNQLLSRHGEYEFPPNAYVDITTFTRRYGNPLDLSFSQETLDATVSWQSGGCCWGGIKTHVFRVVSYSKITPQEEQEKKKTKTPVRVQIPQKGNPLPMRSMVPRTGMSQQDAERILRQSFSRFTEIQQTYYIAQVHYPYIINDLMNFGNAKFDIEMDRNNALFLVLTWHLNGQRRYMLYPWVR
jgi:hypothetical protein